MARQWTLQIGNVTVMPRKNHPGEFDSNWLDRSKLQKGIELASDMSRTAFLKLVQFKMQRLSTDEQLEVQYALAKYFGIDPSDGGYAHYVKGITNVYMAIQVGLSAAYDIVVFDPTDKKAFTQAAGYVRPTRQMIQSGEKSAPLSPIRRRLNIPEEWHHHEWNSPWTGFEEVGRIHISLALLLPGDPPADSVARTIVHEASHKFARTTDVLYKHQSTAQSVKDSGAESVDHARLTINKKTITPMAGAKKGARIDPALYMENADSYAWTARRLWKRFG
jgi:hypothetical protein